MPAARPSRASVENAMSAIVASGFLPSVLRVMSDGSFEVDIEVAVGDMAAAQASEFEADVLTWEKVS